MSKRSICVPTLESAWTILIGGLSWFSRLLLWRYLHTQRLLGAVGDLRERSFGFGGSRCIPNVDTCNGNSGRAPSSAGSTKVPQYLSGWYAGKLPYRNSFT